MAGSTELLKTLAAEVTHRIHCRLEEFARIELASAPGRDFPERRGHRQPAVGVDIDLADAMPDAANDLLDRHAPGLRHLAAELVEGVLQRLRHRRRTVHHQMRVRQPAVDFLYHLRRKNLTVRLARELVGAMRGA